MDSTNNTVNKTTLGLNLPTDPRWADIASENLEDILTDHAYCEQKAASSCISLIIHFPEKQKLVDTLTPVVAEEWDHFRRVMEHIRKRGYTFGPQRKDEYVTALYKLEKKGDKREKQLMEKLLINALIEARSCERFKILHQNISDQELKEFYEELMISEAGHYKNFLELAKCYVDENIVNQRWQELLNKEAEIIRDLGVRGGRMH